MTVEEPRLTIGIPTYNRPLRLVQAIQSALGQQRPARVLIADQTGDSLDAVKGFLANPLVRYIKTDAASLWDNWAYAAESCDTEFFCWLQDDDVVSYQLSKRVVWAFDQFPNANLYLARLGLSNQDGLANWWQGTGPMVPMNLLYGFPTIVSGLIVTAASYFLSWALSPGVAFRWSTDACKAIRRCPTDCDLYNERIVLAELGLDSEVICDPATVGYWVQHTENESKRQVKAGGRIDQFPILAKRLDELLANRPEWRQALDAYTLLLGGPAVPEHWLADSAEYTYRSETYDAARQIVEGAVARYKPIAPAKPPETQPRTAEASAPKKARKAVAR